MPEGTASHEFDLHVLTQLEKLFKEGELETMVEGPQLKSDGRFDETKMAVLVIHRPTGKQVSSEKYNSQIRNKVACLLTLLLDTPRSS